MNVCAMQEQKLCALCSYVPTMSSPPRLVALMVQDSQEDASGAQVRCGVPFPCWQPQP